MPGYFDLNNRVALVTGASRRRRPRRSAEVGATAILNGRYANTLKVAADRMRDRGLKAESGVRHQRRHRQRGGPYLVDPLVRIESPRSGKDEDRVHWFRKYGHRDCSMHFEVGA